MKTIVLEDQSFKSQSFKRNQNIELIPKPILFFPWTHLSNLEIQSAKTQKRKLKSIQK